MVFSSLVFLFLFLPVCLALYYAVPGRFAGLRNFILLCMSLAFYFYGEPRLVWVMLLSILMNYISGRLLGGDRPQGARRAIMVLSVVGNLSILFFFKYCNFVIENLNALGASLPLLNVVMPIGISFFTFQAMSYVLDVYRKTAAVQRNIGYLALYITMFPQLIAGPIVRYSDIALEITARTHSLRQFSQGITRFCHGLGKKVLIANAMGLVADEIFAASAGGLSVHLAWLGAISYTFQIYFDFSGYSDMAIGLGKMFGFTFLENFNFPYISRSITEFWRRWHISLSTWFRDYVYIPLGGSRCARPRQIFNLFVVWLLTGFWHGAEWTFLLWGLYYAALLVLEKFFLQKPLEKAPRFLRHAYALLLVIAGWVLFRCDSVSGALLYYRQMADFGALLAPDLRVLYYLREYGVQFVLAALLSTPVLSMARKFLESRGILRFPALLSALCVFFILFFVVLSLLQSSYNPFIYFRF